MLGSEEIDMRLLCMGYTHAALAFKHWVQLGVALSQRIFLQRHNWHDWTGLFGLPFLLSL
jgi:hypothetical protein